MDPRLLRDGIARPARASPASGVSSRRSSRRTTRGRQCSSRHRSTFRVYMVVAAVGTVLAAGYLLWMFQRVGSARRRPSSRARTSTTCTCRVDRVDADAAPHRGPRRVPEPALPLTNPAVNHLAHVDRMMPAADHEPPSSTTTRSRPRSSSRATIVVVLIADLFFEDARGRRRGSRRSACWPRSYRSSRSRSTATPGHVRRRLHGRSLRARIERVLPRGRVHHVLLSVDYISEGDYYQGEYYFLLLTRCSA